MEKGNAAIGEFMQRSPVAAQMRRTQDSIRSDQRLFFTAKGRTELRHDCGRLGSTALCTGNVDGVSDGLTTA